MMIKVLHLDRHFASVTQDKDAESGYAIAKGYRDTGELIKVRTGYIPDKTRIKGSQTEC
jgi:hypothetical protein